MLLSFRFPLWDFNTSHVTVYQLWKLKLISMNYISIHLMLRFIDIGQNSFQARKRFQYISCYGLSKLSIHQMDIRYDFNTSHVTVYRILGIGLRKFHIISIHLMLRFIIQALSEVPQDKLFQYISCYGLSRYSFCWFRSLYKISIHLMLRFISAFCIFVRYNTGDFNTSHVTVYHCRKPLV